MRTYKGLLNKKNMPENGVFVFGSNAVCINGNPKKGSGGSALVAHLEFGVGLREDMNNCLSKSGKAWGLVTVTGPGKKRSKTPNDIKKNISRLYEFALKNPDKEFLIAYTGIDSYNLNGYSNSELAEMFSWFDIPNNVVFEFQFSTLLSA